MTDSADGVLFDFFGIGKKVQIAWTAAGSQNAFLILDRNGNGLIDSAQEMFGNMTEQPVSENPNGFIALSVFDKPENGGNGDGVIDKNDTIFSKLQVWQDVNHDGVSQPNELRLLNEVGIISISLKYHESRWSDIYGNAFRYRSRVTFSPERPSTWVYDVFLLLAPR
ncbi:MAG: hypothetical protein DMG57_01535 [Acidobacteria bacterium]|nr:MAG: hypothetical protein DMG57_01535 [Acidobacteriota bacterium]